jgi:hypothetical protein
MPRYGRYLRLEKNIAASDTGGILERWRYGRRLLSDGKATTPAGNLRHGVLAALIADAKSEGYELSEREIRYRLQCARTYETEPQIGKAIADFKTWFGLIEARFPQVDVPDTGDPYDPYDPRDADEKWRDFRAQQERRKAENPEQPSLPGFELPTFFSHDTYGPRTHLSDLIAACDESERFTANMAKRDTERRAYVGELLAAVDGDQRKTWYEAEARRLGLDNIGVSDWESFDEIMSDWLGPRAAAGLETDPEDDEEL